MSFLHNLLNEFKVNFFSIVHIALKTFWSSHIRGPITGIILFLIAMHFFSDGNVLNAGYFCFIDEYNNRLLHNPNPTPVLVADGEIPRPRNSLQYSEVKRLLAEGDEDWEVAEELEPYRASYECLLIFIFIGFTFYYASLPGSPYVDII